MHHYFNKTDHLADYTVHFRGGLCVNATNLAEILGKKIKKSGDPLQTSSLSKNEDLSPPRGAHVWGHHDPIVTALRINSRATSSIYPAFSLSTRKMYCFK